MDNNSQPIAPNQTPISNSEIEDSLSKQDERNNSAPNKPKYIIIAIIVLVLLAGGFAFVSMGGKSDNKKSDNTANTTETKKETKLSPEEVIADLDKKATELHKKQKGYKYEIFKTDSYSKGSIEYKVEGVDYLVKSLPQDNAGFWHRTDPADSNLDSSTAYKESQESLDNTLNSLDEYMTTTLKFKKIDTITIKGNASDWSWNIYSKDDVLCKLDSEANFGISAGCITEDKLTDSLNKIKPFVELYLKTSNNKYQSYGPVAETDGKNDFKIAKLSSNIAPLTFIKASTQDEWRYVGVFGFQTLSSCDEYEKDAEIRQAFEGTSCATQAGERKVTKQ